MDEEITEEWTTPKTLSFLEEDVVPESQLQLALGMIERLCDKIDPEHILKVLVSIVQELLAANTQDWRYKYTAFMIITSMCDEIDDMSEVKNILPTVFENLLNENPKIRFACLQVIEVASDTFSPVFQKTYFNELYPTLLKLMSDSILRNQLQCTETIIAFIENIPEELIGKSLVKEALDVFFPLLMSDTTYVSLKENILNVLSEIVQSSEEEFKPYSTKCMEILIKVLDFCLSLGKEKTIYGPLLELITKIGPHCEEEYKKVIPNIAKAMIQLQNNIPYSTDPIFEYLNAGWEKLIPYTITDFKDLIAPIIECTLKLVSNVPTMKTQLTSEQEFNISDLLKDDNQDPQIVKSKLQVNTAETQDFAASISLLCTVIESYKGEFAPYLEQTEKIIIPLLSFDANDDIRSEAANAVPYLIDCIISQKNTEALHIKSKTYVATLVLCLEKEEFNACIGSQLDAIGSLVEKVGMFLQKNEITELFSKLLNVFDKVEKSRLSLISNIEKTHKEFEEDRKLGNNKINSDDEDNEEEEDILDDMDKDLEDIEDVLVSIADVMGSFFKTHKELSMESVEVLMKNLLPKYFTKEATSFEIKMGLYIIDDMIEFLGQGLLQNQWADLVKLVLAYANDKEPFLRQASLYGLGEFAVNTSNGFENYSNIIIESIDSALAYSSDGQTPEQWNLARDNAIAAIGKIIKFQGGKVNAQELIKKWVQGLPLNEDEIEGKKQHKQLVEMLLNNVDSVVGDNKEMLPKVIRILCKVYDTKMVDDDTNKNIKTLLDGMKTNTQFASFIQVASSEAKEELKEKMKELLS